MIPFHRGYRLLQREVLSRRQPHGLMSGRYLWPGRNVHIRTHRALWWANGERWPRSVWLLMECWLWMRWTFWQAWVSSWRAVRFFGPDIAEREGIPLGRQAWRVLWLALGWCIPPRDSYGFGLHRQPERALDYVYDVEVAAYHAQKNRRLGKRPDSLTLLQDKLATAEALRPLGIPVVDTLRCIEDVKHCPALGQLLDGGGRVFCKTRSGNRGRGAFMAWVTEDGLQGRSFAGYDLFDTATVEQAWRQLLMLDKAIIQPCLKNHPVLAALAHDEEAITVRFISQWQDSALSSLVSVLEIPTGRTENARTVYTLLPIDALSGLILPWPQSEYLPPLAHERMAQVWTKLPHGLSIPCWDELVSGSYRAHRQFPDIWAIAWDWVVTPSGPILLEGNAGWVVTVPQSLRGGFLAELDAGYYPV